MNRSVALYLEKHMPDFALFKTFTMPEKSAVSVFREASIRAGEVKMHNIQFNNSVDSYSDIICLIEAETCPVKQKYLRMCLHSAFTEHKFWTIDDIVRLADKLVKDMRLTASFLHPLKNYVDLLTMRLVSMSVDGIQPTPENFMTREELSAFTLEFNDLIPKHLAATKLVIEVASSKMVEGFYKSAGLVLAYDNSKVAVYLETENSVKLIELDKTCKAQTLSDGSLRVSKLERKTKRKSL